VPANSLVIQEEARVKVLSKKDRAREQSPIHI
jgi:hypothetical protein